MSKNLVLLIIGAFVGWLVFSIFTGDYESEYLIALIVGSVLGYQIGKKDRK